MTCCTLDERLASSEASAYDGKRLYCNNTQLHLSRLDQYCAEKLGLERLLFLPNAGCVSSHNQTQVRAAVKQLGRMQTPH